MVADFIRMARFVKMAVPCANFDKRREIVVYFPPKWANSCLFQGLPDSRSGMYHVEVTIFMKIKLDSQYFDYFSQG